jgi:hypothetical protein
MSDKPLIKYTDKDFASLKASLEEYTKRKYPNTFKDFGANSPISWYIDLIAYLGDQLSFNLDYSVNESFLDSAIDANNIIELGRANGYKHNPVQSSYGSVAFYISVPVDSNLRPDSNYLPILRRGTELSSTAKASFILLEDVNFADPNNPIVVTATNSTTGVPTRYAVKAYGQVISGEINRKEIEVGAFQKFLKVEVPDNFISEIISVYDSNGHEYYEVDSLCNGVVYKPILNKFSDTNVLVPNIIKPFPAPRRFEFLYQNGKYYLQFGYGSSTDLEETSSLEPANVILQRQGKSYLTDTIMDPNNLISGDKFGIAPSNTILTVTYRRNTTKNSNAAVGTITNISNALFEFPSTAIDQSVKNSIITSLETDNEEPIIGNNYIPNTDELKIKIYGTYSAQNRAVTKSDYENICYNMPSMFGSIKRCSAMPSNEKGQRVINLYTISEDQYGHLVQSNDALKENLKIWISKYKMLNDSIQILDAKIVNFAIDYVVLSTSAINSVTLLKNITEKLRELFENPLFIGEPLNVVQIYSTINSVQGVADTTKVIIHEMNGGLYSNTRIGLNNYKTADGRLYVVPNDVILELKYPNIDIRGIIK